MQLAPTVMENYLTFHWDVPNIVIFVCFKYVYYSDNAICTYSLNIKGDKLQVAIGIMNCHCEINLLYITLNLDIEGIKFLLKYKN